jgi:hypothetical protein
VLAVYMEKVVVQEVTFIIGTMERQLKGKGKSTYFLLDKVTSADFPAIL